MRITFTVLLYLVISTLCGMEPESDEMFFSKLSKQSNDICSITSHFTQTKYLKLINNKLISQGTFYYQKKGKIRFDYSDPKKMSIVMIPQKLQIIAAEKKTTYNLSSQKQLAELAVVMDACISGKINELPKGYKAEYQLENGWHVIRITLSCKGEKNPYSLIELKLNLNNYSLERLTLFEKSEDYTIYDFTNIVVNQSLKQSLFII